MQTNFDDFETGPSKRPTFLTVLCILTFIGSGWGILSSVWSYTTAKQTVKMFAQAGQENRHDSLSKKDSVRLQKQHESSEYMIGKKIGASARTMFTVDNIHKKSIGDLIAAVFTLTGAIFMWFQKRWGFYIYIIGVVIGIVLPFYLFGNDLLTIGIASFGAFFGLLFIALYALNLKSMDR
jgi:uncharacterized membrane protein (DUF2068 family)